MEDKTPMGRRRTTVVTRDMTRGAEGGMTRGVVDRDMIRAVVVIKIIGVRSPDLAVPMITDEMIENHPRRFLRFLLPSRIRRRGGGPGR